MARIVIIGAGVVGVSCAAFLQRDGHEVLIVDPLGPGEACSFGNAGSIGPGSVMPIAIPGVLRQAASWVFDPESPLWIDWRYLPRALPWLARFVRAGSRARVEEIAPALRALHADSFDHYRRLLAGDAAGLLHISGQLYIYESDAAFAKDTLGRDLRASFGVRSEILGPDEIRQLEPSLRPGIPRAVYLPDNGHCSNPHRLVATIAEVVARNGGSFVRTAATGFDIGPEGVRAVLTEREALACDAVVIAAGAWSAGLARSLGVEVPLESLRGYHAMMPLPDPAPRRAIYPLAAKIMATPMEGGLRVAGTAEIAGLDAAPNPRRAEVLAAAASRYFPLLSGRPISTWVGHRPATPDSLPVIGRSPNQRNVLFAFGHGQTGLIGAPTTGLLIADLLAGRAPSIDPYPYRSERF